VRKYWQGDYELLLLDNGSEDDTPTLMPTVDRYFRSDVNMGFSKGFNELVSKAEGEFVCLMNNDAEFVEQPIFTYNGGLVFFTANNIRSPRNHREQKREYPKKLKIDKFQRSVPSGVAMFMAKDVFDEVGGFSEEFVTSGEDTDLCFKLWEADHDIYVDEHVWVNHEGKASAKQLDDWKKIWKDNTKRVKEKWQKYF
jgi:GT2 family glycosyltransferase